jgi:hypothetical protein
MAINFDSSQATAAPSSGRLDRHDAQARQDRWMLELERGMLAAGAKKELRVEYALASPAQPAARSPAVPNFMWVAPKAEARVAGSASVRQDAGFAPARRDTDVSAAPPNTTVALRQTRGSRWQEARSRHPLVETPAPVGVGVLMRQPAAISSVLQLPAAAAAQINVGLPAGTPVPGVAPLPGINAAVRSGSAPLGITAPPAPERAEPPVSSAEAAEANAAEEPAPSAEPEAFDKRLMHVFVQPDGVHAFIRDAELGAAQMRSVALMLSAELAVAGQSLAALTVNGRTVEARVAAFDDLVSLPNNERDVLRAASKHTPHSLAPVRKGNPQ